VIFRNVNVAFFFFSKAFPPPVFILLTKLFTITSHFILYLLFALHCGFTISYVYHKGSISYLYYCTCSC